MTTKLGSVLGKAIEKRVRIGEDIRKRRKESKSLVKDEQGCSVCEK